MAFARGRAFRVSRGMKFSQSAFPLSAGFLVRAAVCLILCVPPAMLLLPPQSI